MLKNLKRASAIMLSLAMAVQFGMADTYFANTLSEEPIIEETQEQEPVTVEEGSQQVAVEQTEAPAIDAKEEFVQVPETKSVTLSYVAEDGTILQEATTHEYEMGYSLNSDASVMLNFDGYTLKDVVMNDSQIVAAAQANLNVTSDLTSVKFVYQKVMTESHPEANEAQEENKTEEKAEEDAEADPEAKEELPEYPAFDMSATAGNVTVHVTAAEGVLPSGAQLIVKRVTRKAILNAVEETVTEKDKEVDSAIALDITIVNADGIEIQPNGIVNVSFENVAVGGEEVNVYHVTDDASTVTEVATNTQSFDANHFSIYVITGEKKVELTTFNFVANEQNVSTQIVKTGDTLITPTAPDIAGKAFVEWQENGSKFDGFGVQTITKTEARTITAKYEDALYVYFYNPEGTQIMRTEKVADHNSHDYSHVSYDVDATHKLVGWAAERNGTTNIADKITVPEGSTSVNVYAIIKEGYWVTFDSDGGSAIDSQFVFDKISLNDQTTPTKPGYTFVGWYNGESKVVDGTQITKPMTLKAHWKATKVSYTVIHWWENADDDGYSFHESENKTGLTGTEANATAKSYEGFTAQPVTKKTIKGDGSTIVSVYYKRNVYDVKFYSYGSYSFLDYTKPEEYVNLRITAKYGQDISKQWPTKNGSSTWSTEDHGTTYQANINTMPLGGAKFYGPQTGKSYCEAFYYVEILPGENSSIIVGGIKYRLDHTDKMYGSGIRITKEDQYPLKGFTFNDKDSAKIGNKYDGASFYYTRNLYDLKFINNGKEDKSVEKKYEQSISSENYTPTRPSSLPEYYVFDGWYENELCEGEAFNFTGKKMPAQNVTLYAKWTASKVKFTYNLNNPEGALVKKTEDVAAGTVASTVLPSIPTINEYSFAGWYYADGNGNITSEVFNTNNTITKDTSVVGKWLYKGELRVVYNPGAETGATVPTDDKVYAGGARVTVAGNATTTSDMKFLGWKLNGNVYKPGQSFEVNKDIANKDNQIILTATWGNAETSTTLTYDPGNGIGTATRVDVMNNEAVKIKAHDSDVLVFTAPVAEGKEYYFAGWADSSTGNATYADGQTINIDANGENVLYAVWVEKTEITLVANSGTRTYNGAEQSIEGFESTTMNGYTVSGLTAVTKGTNVGEYINTVFDGTAKVKKDGVDVTDKVVVKTRAGKLVITPKSIKTQEITVTKPADSQYDGNEHKNKPTVKDGKKVLVEDTDYTLSYSEDVINVGTVTVTITGTGNYEGTVNTYYEITPRKVIMTSADGSKVYDGSALTKNKVTESEDGFVKDDGATYTVTGSQTETGSSKNTFTYTLNEKTLEKNYVIETKEGTLEVTPVTDKVVVEIKGKTKTETYNGNTHEVEGYDVTNISNALYLEEAIHFEGAAKASRKDVGTTYMGLNASQFSNTSANFTNVTFKVTDGWLKVDPKSIDPEDEKTGIQVTKPDDTMYNGEEQKNKPTVEDTKTGVILVENVDYTLSYTAAVNAGTVEVTITGIGNYTGTAKTSYEITKRNVTLTSATDSKVYDKTPLTNSNITIGGDGFVKEEGATYNVTGSQTSVGESDNEFTYTLKSNTKAENYNITTHNGKLIVTAEASEVTVVITGRNGTFPYDGTEKSVKGYDVSITQGSTYTEADFTFSGNDEVKGTEANTYPMGLKVSDFTNNNTNYSSVTFVVNDGSLVINPKSIIPDGPDTPDEKKTGIEVTDPEGSIYDGLPHVNPLKVTDTKTGKELEENKDYTLTYVGDVVNVGTVKVKVKGIGNYTGEFTKKYQITPREYTVTTDNAEKPYDGTALTAGGRVNNLVDGETVTLKITGSQTEVGSSNNTYSLTWDGSAKEKNYTHGTDSIGLLTVTPKSIIPSDTNGIEVTKPADSKYDGKVHENKPTVKDNKTDKTLVEGTDYTLSYKGDTTNAGTVTVTITGAGNYTGSHNVEYQITKRNVTLTSATDSKVYDKTPLTNSNIAIGGDGFAKLEGASYHVTGSQTNVGDSDNEFTYKLNDDTKASNYNIEVKFGKLYITTQDGQVIVVITGHKKTYDYDGTEKTVDGYDVSITEGSTYAETDFTFNGNAEVKATEANTYPMGLKASDFTNNNTNYSSVTFVVNDGSLVINPKSIIPDKPNTPDEKKTGIEVTNPEDSIYDGLPHVNPLTITDTKTKTDLEENKDYTLTYSSDVINVGTVEVNVKGIGNYTGEFTKTYKITPREYTVTTDSAKKVYDGTALTAGGKIEGIVDGEVVVVHTTGSQTEVGSTPNTYKLEWKKASSKNYKLKEDSIGTLTVTEQTIDPGKDPDNPNPNYSGVTINNPSNSVYDGKKHKWSPAVTDKEGNALVEGTDYEVAYSISDFRNVGIIEVIITGIGNYTGTVTRTYEITPKAYTVTTESAKKVYDGTALTAGGKIEGIVSGETVEFTTTGSRMDEGTSKNTYSLKWNGSAIQTNYKLAKESIGDLTVTPKSIIPDEPDTPDDKKTGITVSNPKDSKYDGQDHREVLTVKDTKTGKDLIANKDYTVVYSDDLVNAGTVTIKVSGLGNYSGSFTKTYKITKRLVTLTSATVSKTYDGQALTNTSITVSGDGFVEGEGASYEVTGTQTSVGNSANAFEYKLNEKTLASNYDITKVVGTLTITAAPAPVTPPTSPTPVSPPPVTPRYIQQVVPALTPQEEVKKEKTPKAEPKEEKVEKEKTPKARPEKFWALINLICAIVTVLFGLLLLISKRHKNKDDEDDETKDQTTTNEDEEKEQEKKRGAFTRVLAVLIAILSVVFFLVTEDMSLRWTWTDQWTIWMVVIGLVQIVVFFVGRKWKNVDDDEDEQAQQA